MESESAKYEQALQNFASLLSVDKIYGGLLGPLSSEHLNDDRSNLNSCLIINANTNSQAMRDFLCHHCYGGNISCTLPSFSVFQPTEPSIEKETSDDIKDFVVNIITENNRTSKLAANKNVEKDYCVKSRTAYCSDELRQNFISRHCYRSDKFCSEMLQTEWKNVIEAPQLLNQHLVQSVRFMLNARLKYCISVLLRRHIRNCGKVSEAVARLLACSTCNESPSEMDDMRLILPNILQWDLNEGVNHKSQSKAEFVNADGDELTKVNRVDENISDVAGPKLTQGIGKKRSSFNVADKSERTSSVYFEPRKRSKVIENIASFPIQLNDESTLGSFVNSDKMSISEFQRCMAVRVSSCVTSFQVLKDLKPSTSEDSTSSAFCDQNLQSDSNTSSVPVDGLSSQPVLDMSNESSISVITLPLTFAALVTVDVSRKRGLRVPIECGTIGYIQGKFKSCLLDEIDISLDTKTLYDGLMSQVKLAFKKSILLLMSMPPKNGDLLSRLPSKRSLDTGASDKTGDQKLKSSSKISRNSPSPKLGKCDETDSAVQNGIGRMQNSNTLTARNYQSNHTAFQEGHLLMPMMGAYGLQRRSDNKHPTNSTHSTNQYHRDQYLATTPSMSVPTPYMVNIHGPPPATTQFIERRRSDSALFTDPYRLNHPAINMYSIPLRPEVFEGKRRGSASRPMDEYQHNHVPSRHSHQPFAPSLHDLNQLPQYFTAKGSSNFAENGDIMNIESRADQTRLLPIRSNVNFNDTTNYNTSNNAASETQRLAAYRDPYTEMLMRSGVSGGAQLRAVTGNGQRDLASTPNDHNSAIATTGAAINTDIGSMQQRLISSGIGPISSEGFAPISQRRGTDTIGTLAAAACADMEVDEMIRRRGSGAMGAMLASAEAAAIMERERMFRRRSTESVGSLAAAAEAARFAEMEEFMRRRSSGPIGSMIASAETVALMEMEEMMRRRSTDTMGSLATAAAEAARFAELDDFMRRRSSGPIGSMFTAAEAARLVDMEDRMRRRSSGPMGSMLAAAKEITAIDLSGIRNL